MIVLFISLVSWGFWLVLFAWLFGGVGGFVGVCLFFLQQPSLLEQLIEMINIDLV